MEIDPENIRALSLLSFKFTQRVAYFASPDRQADLHRADELASLAIKIDPDYPLAHTAKGDVLLVAGRYREAIDSYRARPDVSSQQHSAWIGYGLQLISVSRNRPSPMPTRRCGSVRTTPLPHGQLCISPRPSPSASCRTMRRRLYGLSGLKLLLPRMLLMGFVRSALLALAGQRGRGARNNAALFGERQCPYPDHVSMACSTGRKPLPSYNPLVLARLLMWRKKFDDGLRKAGLPE